MQFNQCPFYVVNIVRLSCEEKYYKDAHFYIFDLNFSHLTATDL